MVRAQRRLPAQLRLSARGACHACHRTWCAGEQAATQRLGREQPMMVRFLESHGCGSVVESAPCSGARCSRAYTVGKDIARRQCVVRGDACADGTSRHGACSAPSGRPSVSSGATATLRADRCRRTSGAAVQRALIATAARGGERPGHTRPTPPHADTRARVCGGPQSTDGECASRDAGGGRGALFLFYIGGSKVQLYYKGRSALRKHRWPPVPVELYRHRSSRCRYSVPVQ